MRWVLLDEVLSIEKDRRSRARSRVPEAEFSPEFLMLEMMAQTGALLVGAQNDFRDDVVFAKIENVSFPAAFRAGDPLEIEASSENVRPEGGWIDASIRNDGQKVAEARILLMNAGRLVPGHPEPISFHAAFMNHYKIREKIR